MNDCKLVLLVITLEILVLMYTTNRMAERIVTEMLSSNKAIWPIVRDRLNHNDSTHVVFRRALNQQWMYIKSIDQDTVVYLEHDALKRGRRPKKVRRKR